MVATLTLIAGFHVCYTSLYTSVIWGPKLGIKLGLHAFVFWDIAITGVKTGWKLYTIL